MVPCMTTKRRDAASTVEKVSDRVRRVTVSDESVDRYNTTFAADGWETRNFVKNPVVLWSHRADALPLGKATVSTSGKRLVADVEFFTEELNPDAPRVLRMLDDGVLAISHRFDPIEEEYNAERERGDWRDWAYPPIDYKRQELLEISVVTVPGNPNALPQGRDAGDLRLIAEGALIRSAVEAEPDIEHVKALRAAAENKKKRSEPQAAPAVEATPPAQPVEEKKEASPASAEDEVFELPEGVDAAALGELVKETVAETVAQSGRGAALRRSGTIELA